MWKIKEDENCVYQNVINLPIHLMTEVRIWRYLVFCALKKVKGPRKSVKMAWNDVRTEKESMKPYFSLYF